MVRFSILLISSLFLLTACETTVPTLAADDKPLPQLYRIDNSDTVRIQFRILDSVNALRQAAGVPPVRLNARLNAAAATHSRDMSVQNRAWHFGSDGSSPIDRLRRVGYTARWKGENIAETFDTELETLVAWMEQLGPRDVVLDAQARDLGFAWYQEVGGKTWWTLITGGDAPATGLQG